MNRTQSEDRSNAADASGLGISAPLKRLVLISDPRRFGAIRLWRAMGDEERRTAARACLNDEENGRNQLNRIVAKSRNFRLTTVQKWSEDKICRAMPSVRLHNHPKFAFTLLRCYVSSQAPMVAFLDALGAAHEEGKIDSWSGVDANEDVVRSAVEKLVKAYGAQAIAVLLLTLCLVRAPAGEKGRSCLQELLKTPRGEDDFDSEATDSSALATAGSPEDQTDREDPTRQISFTTLDRLLILAAVDSAGGIRGALTADELDDAVDELVTLNGRRHWSHFHAGFRDVLFGKSVLGELPAENQPRLRWYWTGAVQGWARREQWDRIVRAYATNPVVKRLGNGSNSASMAAVQHIVKALLRKGRAAEVARFVEVRAIVGQPALFPLLLDAATELLGRGDAASALPIFDLLMKARKELEKRGALQDERLLLDAHRREPTASGTFTNTTARAEC